MINRVYKSRKNHSGYNCVSYCAIRRKI